MDEPTLLNMSCGLRKFDFCIYENKGTDQLGEGVHVTVQLLVEWVTGDPEPPPQFFKVLHCNVSSF